MALKNVTCEKCGDCLNFPIDKPAYCAMCESKWTDDELRILYLKLEVGVLETDLDWWRDCLRVVRRVLIARDDDDAVLVLRGAGWGDTMYAARLRRLAGIEQTERPCPECSGSGKVKR